MTTTFFRLLKDSDKGRALEQAVATYRDSATDEERTFSLDPKAFTKVPNTPFAYWVDEEIRDLFVKLPPFESEGRTVKQGLATADDFRFVRAWWEVDPARRLDPCLAGAPSWRENLEAFQEWCRNRTWQGKYWVPFAKGGEYSPYYSDIHLVVNWKDEGAEMDAFEGSVIRNRGYYFRPGVTWPSRPHRRGGFAAVPAGSLFSHTGTMIFSPADQFEWLLAVLNSDTYIALLHLLMPRGTGDTGQTLKYEVGYVKAVPLPQSTGHEGEPHEDVTNLVEYRRVTAATLNPASPVYQGRLGGLVRSVTETTSLNEWARNQFGISQESLEALLEEVPPLSSLLHDVGTEAVATSAYVQTLIDAAAGRHDVRPMKDRSLQVDLAHPFAALPVVPPATLVGPDGLPATSGNIVSEEWLRTRPDAISLPEPETVEQPTIPDSDYPLFIPWDGILVDDETSNADIVERMRQVLRVLHGDRWSEVERELTEELGVQSLRHYMTSPNGFFDDHLKRYSKSRRKAAIYWPLSTKSGGYTVWLYYPRVTSQTLFTIVHEYLGKRRDVVEWQYGELAELKASERSRSQQKEFDRLSRDREELADFEGELLRVANLPYEPDHDDGVPICAAPFYRLFRNGQWSKYLQSIWEELQAGEFDWSHLAYRMWPDRVREKARKDRSIAIAHGLEESS